MTLDALLPGRNYSISVQAVSNKAESKETVIYQVTRPASPIIEDLKSIERGLNISWKSDVNSRQEKFEVTYNRKDIGESVTTSTTASHIDVKDLYPGAGYEVKVVAISHGLKSEPHAHFQAVCKFFGFFFSSFQVIVPFLSFMQLLILTCCFSFL